MKWLILVLVGCFAGGWIGHRIGWRTALTGPEIEAAFSIFPARSIPSLLENPELPPDTRTVLQVTIPELFEAMNARDIDAYRNGMRKLERLDAGRLEESLRQIEPGDRSAQVIFELLAMRDPARAFALTSELYSVESASTMHQIAVRRWGRIDPQAAWAAVREWSDGDASTRRGPPATLEKIVLSAWAETDLDSALIAWSELPDDSKGNAFDGITRHQSTAPASSRERTLSFLKDQPSSEGRTWAFGSVIQYWVDQTSFGEVIAWIDSQTGEFSADEIASFERKAAFIEVQARPRETAEWLLARSDDRRRSEDLETLIHAWSLISPNGAGEWLKEQPLGPETDAAVWRFAQTISDEDPESAFYWAREIRTIERRRGLIRLIVDRWKEVDLNEAERFLAGQILTDEEREWTR